MITDYLNFVFLMKVDFKDQIEVWRFCFGQLGREVWHIRIYLSWMSSSTAPEALHCWMLMGKNKPIIAEKYHLKRYLRWCENRLGDGRWLPQSAMFIWSCLFGCDLCVCVWMRKEQLPLLGVFAANVKSDISKTWIIFLSSLWPVISNIVISWSFCIRWARDMRRSDEMLLHLTQKRC